jgi:hypothetical protein
MESLSPSTINVRLSAVCKLVGEARRNNLIGSEEAASLTDVPNICQAGHPAGELADPRAGERAFGRPRPLHLEREARLRDLSFTRWLCPQAERAGRARRRDHPATRGKMGPGRPRGQRPANPDCRHPHLDQARHQCLDDCGRHRRRPAAALGFQKQEGESRHVERLGGLVGS